MHDFSGYLSGPGERRPGVPIPEDRRRHRSVGEDLGEPPAQPRARLVILSKPVTELRRTGYALVFGQPGWQRGVPGEVVPGDEVRAREVSLVRTHLAMLAIVRARQHNGGNPHPERFPHDRLAGQSE